jgi:homogentisate phytyltransferase/homogentisate geranylgeranyltransferase
VEIDKINKPYLPIASGALTKNQGIAIIMLSLLTSLTLGRTQAWPLQAVLISSGVLGSIYSLPPFRLKRFPIFAALCILAVRGSIVNAG